MLNSRLKTVTSFLFVLGIFSTNSHRCDNRKHNKLIYILLDGFRYDYLDDQPKEQLPGFNKFLDEGVKAEYMTPNYPSISYPAWTSLVTGLWAESHGIVGNYFYDAENQDTFSIFDADKSGKKKWWTAEPIWTTATKAGHRTAVILWSRCDVAFDGINIEYCEPFDKIRGPEIFKTNIQKAIEKLQEGFDFIQVYNEHTDNVGHDSGPGSESRRQAVRELDATIAYMQEQIEEMGMEDQVNIVIVGDHGMADTSIQAVSRVYLDDYLLTDYVENIADAGAFTNIKVKEGYVDKVYKKLKTMPGVDVYRHHEIPDSLHYKDNKYIHDILIKADIKTFIMKSSSAVQTPPKSDYVYYGAHGFDPREEKMRTIFFAKGPDFKGNRTVIDPIQNVDVYPLIARVLGVPPRPNNGSFERIRRALLNNDAATVTFSFSLMMTSITLLTSMKIYF